MIPGKMQDAGRLTPLFERVESGGEEHGQDGMARRVEAHDWSTSSLGARSGWSEELACMARLVLSFRTPACLYWGPNGDLLYNDAYHKAVLGNRHDRALGRPAREVWNEAWDVLAPELKAAYEQGKAIHYEGVLVPLERDGVTQQVYWDYHHAPVYEGGRVAGVFSTRLDVTERVLAARWRHPAGTHLERVLEVVTDGILALDHGWRVTYLNERGAKILGAAGPIAGRDFWAAFPGARYEGSPYVEHLSLAMDEGVAGTFEAFYGNPLNLWFQVEVRRTSDGIVVFFRDVTEQKRALEVIRTNERLMSVGRLAASLAHEINTPLESVTNLLYLAGLDAESPEQKQLLAEAERELERISVIAQQTLRFQKQSSEWKQVNAADLFSTILSLYQGRLRNAGVQVETRWRSEKKVRCLDGEIRQVLSNLVANAIDAMSGGGRLQLRSRCGTDWKAGAAGLFLTVADTGTGMTEATLRRMFEAFYTTKGAAGTGLGMWISAGIMDRHESRLRVRSSQREGRYGTVVTCFLPFGGGADAEQGAAHG